MMAVAKQLVDLIGRTPLLELSRYNQGLAGTIIVKLEYFNPSGSVKDRAAYAMVKAAEERGILHEGRVLIEPTSGNTGIGLAFVAASKGYSLTLVMPDTMSQERCDLIRALGANLVLSDGAKGMKEAIAVAEKLRDATPGAIMLQQFKNPANWKTHQEKTAIEIWEELQGEVDIFVAGVGTGGTITGIGQFLKAKNPQIQIIAVEPEDSPVISKGIAGPHKISGIGAGFVPAILNLDVVDEIVMVTDVQAKETCQELARKEGLLLGISSGAAVWAATMIAKHPENAKKKIVVICPDTGERYLSTGLFSVEGKN